MLRSSISLPLCFAAAALFVTGCSTNSPVSSTLAVKGMSGSVYGGQQPVSGATIQLYAVGSTGDGSAATPLLTHIVTTDSHGGFNITGAYTCPSTSTLLYITATGGDPTQGVANPQLALMTALGPCGTPDPSAFININEITTVAGVYSLAPFMSSFSAVGSGSSDASALASAFVTAGYFANMTTGNTPGANLPPNYTVPIAQINSIADLLAACINSGGGVSGDPSICGSFFALTRPSGAPASTDAIGALLNLANNPTLNTSALYNLIPPTSPFEPTQPTVPPDLALRLLVTSAFGVSPSSLAFAPAVVNFTQPVKTVTVTNGTNAGVNLTSTSITGTDASYFAVVPQPGSDCAITVPANSTCTFQISFTPTATGSRAAYFVVGNTSANPSIAVALSGEGIAGTAGPAMLTPSSLAFTEIGLPQPLTLTNSGSSALTINAISISNAAYTQTNNCGSSLAAGSSCSIQVTVPSYTTATATLTVVDDAAAGPQSASLSYTGSGPVSFPSSVDFGHWAIGVTGSEFLQVMGPGISGSFNFTLGGTNAADFSFSQSSSVSTTSCSYNYRAGGPCNLSLYYKPSLVAVSNAYVDITGVGRFSVMGTGDPTGVDFDLYQGLYASTYAAPITTLALGNTPIGVPVTSPIGIRNTGTVSSLVLNTPVISGANASEFAVTAPACPSACSPSITFTPAGSGTRTATLTYTDASNTVTRTLTLTGTGTIPPPVLTAPTNLYFSNVPMGTVSASQTITVTGYQNHPIQASITSTHSGGSQPFVFIGPSFCASTPCTLSIAYAPTVPADDGANVYVVATDTLALTSGNIQAYGQVAPLPFINFTPSSLTFAAQGLHTVSAPQTVTITNTGSTVLALTFSVPPYGSSPTPDYTLVNHCPGSLAVNASCTVDVRFAPVSTTGTLDTNLEIDGSNVPRYVSLSGTSF